ncbi:MAG: extracellular solute-binding protein [Lachnospiraceae bacterium]|nr:extracellular solute-binding protein [Lachnospiraceae bacterium]
MKRILVVALIGVLILSGCSSKSREEILLEETQKHLEELTDMMSELTQKVDEQNNEILKLEKDNKELIAQLSATPSPTPTNTLTPTPKPQVAYDGSEVSLTFYHTMGQRSADILKKYIKEFNEIYPNIHVHASRIGTYDDLRDQISTELTVGSQPNIAFCYPEHVALYNNIYSDYRVIPLDYFIVDEDFAIRADGMIETLGLTDYQIHDFYHAFFEEGASFADGYMYCLPFSKSSEVLYYNKTFFEENGLKIPKTWDEMEELCYTIKKIDTKCIPLGYDSEANWFITMCEQYGSDYTKAEDEQILFDNRQNKEFVRRFANWYKNGLVTTQYLYGAYTSGLFVAETGTKCYMTISSSSGARHQLPTQDRNGNYPFEVGVSMIPQVDILNPKVFFQGPNLCIFDSDDYQEIVASWLFVKYITLNAEFQAEFAIETNFIPVISSATETDIYQAYMKQNGIVQRVAGVCLEQENAYFSTPAFASSDKVKDEVGRLMQRCFVRIDGIDTFFEEAVKKCQY